MLIFLFLSSFRRNKNYNLSWVPGGPSTPIHLYHTLCQFQNYVTLTFLPLHIPTDEELSNPSIYSENVRSAMASVMRVPTTSHSLEDSMLFLHSTKKKGVQVNVIIQELRSKFKIRTIQELKDALSAFHEMDSNHDGWIDYSEFCRAFKIQDSEKAQILFDLLDSTGNGAIDFREFVFALYAITQDSKELPQTKRQNLIKAFLDVLEIEGDGLLSEDDAKIILKGTSSGLTITEVENRILSMVKETKGYTGLPSRKVSFTDLVQLTQKHEGKLDRLPKTLRAVLQRHVDMKLNKQLASSI